MKQNIAIYWFWIIVIICSIQIVYKFKFEEPYPSLCYPDFAKPDISKYFFLSNLIRQKKYYSPPSKDVDDKFYQNEYLVDDYYDNLYKPRWCSYEFYAYKDGGDSLIINPQLLFKNPLKGSMIDRSIKSRFWDFPKLKDRAVMAMEGASGQSIIIDFDKGKINVINSIHTNYDWKKIAISKFN